MNVRARGRAGCPDQPQNISRLNVLAHDHIDLAHMGIDRVELLIPIPEVHPEIDRLAIGLPLASWSPPENPPAGPYHGPRPGRQDRRTIPGVNIHPRVNGVAEKHTAISIIG